MPSLFRLLFILLLIGGAIYGSMWALVAYVEPEQREMTIRVPPDRLTQSQTQAQTRTQAQAEAQTQTRPQDRR